MKTLSLGGIDDELADALKKKAQRTGTSINRTVLNLIRELIGLDKKKLTRVYENPTSRRPKHTVHGYHAASLTHLPTNQLPLRSAINE